MQEILDIIDPKAPLEEVLESTRRNFKTLTDTGLKAGTYQLVGTEITAVQNVTSTSYVDVAAFTGAFNSSGDLVFFQVNVFVSVTAINCWLKLIVDDTTTIATAIAGCSPSALSISVPLTGATNLNAGQHKYKLQAKVDAGTAIIGAGTDVKSSVTVLEFVKG